MDECVFDTCSVDATIDLGKALGRVLRGGDFVALVGDLGAGKTHFAQGVAAGLGVHEAVASPTFNIVFEYTSGRIPLYHFDLYRLEDASELEDVDFYSITDESSDGASLAEWADRFSDELPEDRLEIAISHGMGASDRRIAAHASGERSRMLLGEWASQAKDAASGEPACMVEGR